MSIIEKAVAKLERFGSVAEGHDAPEAKGSPVAEEPAAPVYRAEPLRTSSNPPRCRFDFAQLKEQGYISSDSSLSALAKDFRLIKHPIIDNALGRGATKSDRANLVLVTSAGPGEGKTFTSLNLALSVSLERDLTVLLIDCDVLKPKLTGLLGLEEERGLIDVLDRQVPLQQVIFHTDIPKLKVIPAGGAHSQSHELLNSDQMRQMIDELAKRYRDRVVIMDGPPFLQTSESRLLTKLVGQVLVVVEAGKTPQPIIEEVAASFSKDQIVGMVLNKATYRSGSYYGRYYGRYGS
jgi:protein-tyrosine kinase